MSTARQHLFSSLFDYGKDILNAVLNPRTKVIQVQTGDSSRSAADADAAEWWQQTGFASMPAPPTPGTPSCQGIVLKNGDRDKVIASRDTRAAGVYGNLKPGEACMYATVGQARCFAKANGSFVAYTTSDNTGSGKSHTFELGPDGLDITTNFGRITMNAAGITLTVGGAALILTPQGQAKLIGTQASVQGQIVGVAGQVATCIGRNSAPVPGVNTALAGATGPSATPSTSVYIGLT